LDCIRLALCKTSYAVAFLSAHLLTFLKNPFKKDAQRVAQIAVKEVLYPKRRDEFGREVICAEGGFPTSRI